MMGRGTANLSAVWTILILLAVLAVASGLYSVHLGVSQMWDIRNYHLYNPFAALNGRYLTDVAPAQLQTYYNPTLDIPFYLLIKSLNDWPRLIAFLIGALHGINLLCVALIAWQLLGGIDGMSRCLRVVLSAISLLIGATGAGSVPMIGSWTGDSQSATPVLAALLLVIYGVNRAQTDPALAVKPLIVAGLFGGFAVGLKLTTATYAVALAASLLVLPAGLRLRTWSSFALAGLFGALLGGGWHHFTMWRLFGNPFFPSFNNIFQSPYASPEAYTDTRYIPKTLWDWLSYPFQWAYYDRPGIVSQLPFRDIRLATAITLSALALLAWLVARFGQQPRRAPLTPGVHAFASFMIVGYLLWLGTFSMYRYLLPIELLSGVPIAIAICLLARREAWTVLAAVAGVFSIITTIPQEWGHAPFQKRYLEIGAPPLPPNTLVLMLAGDVPVAYFIPFLDQDARWISVINNFLSPRQNNLLMHRARTLVQNHRGPLMALQSGAADAALMKVLANFSLTPGSGDCAPLYSNLATERYLLCPLERKATSP
jgi:hypothetical protein